MHFHLPFAIKPKNGYSARNMAKPVHFYCHTPKARQVSVIGDFNNWDAQAGLMSRGPDGIWRAEVLVPHGHHQYVFLVDGRVTLDPRAHGTARSRRLEKVSLLAVS